MPIERKRASIYTRARRDSPSHFSRRRGCSRDRRLTRRAPVTHHGVRRELRVIVMDQRNAGAVATGHQRAGRLDTYATTHIAVLITSDRPLPPVRPVLGGSSS